MDKRKEANMRVKRQITNALFDLMKEKSLASIHITELTDSAGVALASFYRNYCSKEDVLVTLIRDILNEFKGEIDVSRGSFYTYENVLLSFLNYVKLHIIQTFSVRRSYSPCVRKIPRSNFIVSSPAQRRRRSGQFPRRNFIAPSWGGPIQLSMSVGTTTKNVCWTATAF